MVNETKYINCRITPAEIEVARPDGRFDIEITALCDLFFDGTSLDMDYNYGLSVIVPYGEKPEDLTVYNKNIQLTVPTTWSIDKPHFEDNRICWHVSNGGRLARGETLTLNIRQIVCNEMPGDVTVMVSCFALVRTGNEPICIQDVCSLSLCKTFRPLIIDFSARCVDGNITEMNTEGFTSLEQLRALCTSAVIIRPYGVDPPSPPTPPTPVKMKDVMVNWQTRNAAVLELSYGGTISEDKGTQKITVPENVSDIELTAYSPQKTFSDKRKVLI